jgi:uncharacterized membrane protein YhhN
MYCRSFARGCDVSVRRFAQFGIAKKVVLILTCCYGLFAWFLLYPAFEPSLRLVLACYIVALIGMFSLSLFGHSRMLIVGSVLYVVSDSLIALATFVFPENLFVQWLDQLR